MSYSWLSRRLVQCPMDNFDKYSSKFTVRHIRKNIFFPADPEYRKVMRDPAEVSLRSVSLSTRIHDSSSSAQPILHGSASRYGTVLMVYKLVSAVEVSTIVSRGFIHPASQPCAPVFLRPAFFHRFLCSRENTSRRVPLCDRVCVCMYIGMSLCKRRRGRDIVIARRTANIAHDRVTDRVSRVKYFN